MCGPEEEKQASVGCAHISFALNVASPLSVSEIFGGTTLKVLRQAQDKLCVLSVRRDMARSGLGRFAAFGPPTRILIENAKRCQAGRSAACPFECAGEICKPRSGVKSSPPQNAGVQDALLQA
jgi:hypothetical protein